MVDTMMGVGTKSFLRLLHDALGERRCLKLRKANNQAKFESDLVPDFVACTELVHGINKIDIGKLNYLSNLRSDYDKIPGAYREAANHFFKTFRI